MASFAINTTFFITQTLNASENGILGPLGAILTLTGNGVNATGDNNLVVDGAIASMGHGVFASGSILDMIVGSQGEILAANGDGVNMALSAGADLYNAGTISGRSHGINFASSDGTAYFGLNNTGTVSGFYGVSIDAGGSLSTVVNTGTIAGVFRGINAGFSSDTDLVVWNSGTISGSKYAFFGSFGAGSRDRLYNSGLMDGDIDLQGGDDIYNGRYGTVTGSIEGGDGNDIIRGGAGGEAIYGEADNDTLLGRDGNDDLYGGSGLDDLRGGEGNDGLSGGSGSDTLNGGKGDDEITTGGGNDVIIFNRSAGNDTITDFSNNKHVTDLQAFNLTNWGDLNGSGAVTDVTGGVEIDFSLIGGSGILTIAGISMGVLGNPDFIF
ncbi:MAG: calcium-binding protein [Rhodobacteraceae bacterium]|nr:calcium-binding protein [Paracoccaceae bacterium]